MVLLSEAQLFFAHHLGTGHLVTDEAVLVYIRKLEDHRKRCENENRYLEAKAAASRLADLKTAQVRLSVGADHLSSCMATLKYFFFMRFKIIDEIEAWEQYTV
jgi:hypothetical protein